MKTRLATFAAAAFASAALLIPLTAQQPPAAAGGCCAVKGIRSAALAKAAAANVANRVFMNFNPGAYQTPRVTEPVSRFRAWLYARSLSEDFPDPEICHEIPEDGMRSPGPSGNPHGVS